MAEELKSYTVLINGVPHQMRLSKAGADRYGENASPVEAKSRRAANKAATPENKEA